MEKIPPKIKLNNLTKTFGSVKANDNISLDLYPGEILALLGENGSGKTTLMNMLSGIYSPDGGSIVIDGKTVNISSPKDAINLGIGMIHQHFKLVEVFSARENIKLGSISNKQQVDLDELVKTLKINIDLDKKVYDMSVSEKQSIEILKVLYRGADVLVLDEPTAVLTPQEIESLFDTLRDMKSQGKAIIIITHKLDEVLAISDRVTVMHKGRLIDTVLTKNADRFSLTEMMVGRQVDLDIKRVKTTLGDVILDVHELSVKGKEGNLELNHVSFTLRSGEILGVAGIAGSGQKALCEAIAGLQPISGGSILLNEKRIDGKTPREIIQLGVSMAYIPEDRLGMGLVGSMNIPDNLMLKTYKDQKGMLLDRNSAKKEAEQLVEQLSISTPSLNTPVSKLSGGNVQKVLLGREINLSPRVLITAYPVRGLDIGASMTIYDMLNEQKKKGVAVLFVGEDLDVLLALCDRIVVLSSGKVSAIVESKFATKALLGMKMVGMTTDKEDEYV
ncbi:MAG: ABC transporter ATP-binding protein [Eubacteriales bacterium]|nr:ABC transporter ATP-binding protein [Eubacteriales bacterium]